jgi:hypothetical protein
VARRVRVKAGVRTEPNDDADNRSHTHIHSACGGVFRRRERGGPPTRSASAGKEMRAEDRRENQGALSVQVR